jgi:hypothetical protein
MPLKWQNREPEPPVKIILTVEKCFVNILAISDESGNNSVVECNLAKVEVAGSNPVSRSNFHQAESQIRSGENCPA